jgi:hypothetical protein
VQDAVTVAVPALVDVIPTAQAPPALVVQVLEERAPRVVVNDSSVLAALFDNCAVIVAEDMPSAGTELGFVASAMEPGTEHPEPAFVQRFCPSF